MQKCGIILLAAGASTRMGVAKQSLTFKGSTLLQKAVDTALASVCRPVVVVMGARADALRPLISNASVTVIENEHWAKGIGTSIRCGIGAMQSTGVEAAMIMLCDQPLISPAALDAMTARYFSSGKPMVAASYAGSLGTPAIFSSLLFDALLSLKDEQGGKAVINRHPDQVIAIDMPEAEMDLDTQQDYERLTDQY